MEKDTEVLNFAAEVGEHLLQNGAEIYRVEETISRICASFGVLSVQQFVLSNGIIITAEQRGNTSYAKARHIPVQGAQLSKLMALNQLSRDIVEKKYGIAEAKLQLEKIKTMRTFPKVLQILASGLGSAAFCLLFGGAVGDSAAAFIAGILVYAFVLWVGGDRLSRLSLHLLAGTVIGVCCVACYMLGLGNDLGKTIVGGIIPMIPGVSFTNGIRDMAGGDYLSGIVRLLDAILVFACVAIGVGTILFLYHGVMGGAAL